MFELVNSTSKFDFVTWFGDSIALLLRAIVNSQINRLTTSNIQEDQFDRRVFIQKSSLKMSEAHFSFEYNLHVKFLCI